MAEIQGQRVFKFRAWNKELGSMVDLHKLTPFAVDPKLHELNGIFIPNHDNYAVMQYTGLNDRNGKEIYEGDILTVVEGGKREYIVSVVFEHGLWALHGFPNNWPFVRHLSHWWIRSDVIGNVFENPEVLEAK